MIRHRARWNPKCSKKGWLIVHITLCSVPSLQRCFLLAFPNNEGAKRWWKRYLCLVQCENWPLRPKFAAKNGQTKLQRWICCCLEYVQEWGTCTRAASYEFYPSICQSNWRFPSTTFGFSAQKWAVLLHPCHRNISVLCKNIWDVLQGNVTTANRLSEERWFLPVLGRSERVTTIIISPACWDLSMIAGSAHLLLLL